MTLDLASVSRQMSAMVAAGETRLREPGHDVAFELLTTLDPAELRARIATARTSWLVASLVTTLAERHACPPSPPSWTVVATDGSSIAPDRHSPLHFFVLNTGRVRLRYGAEPDASITHQSNVYFLPEDTHILHPDRVRRIPIDGSRLAARRAIAELEALAELVVEIDSPAVALQDGSLILWSVQSEEETVQGWLLERYLAAMERVRDAGVPLASYISAPGSTDVMNALRVGDCPHVPGELKYVDCARCPSALAAGEPACYRIPHLPDRFIFARLLAPGERSALFRSASKVLAQYRQRSADLDIAFFYLNAGDEIARVEVPVWVAEDADLLDRVHLCLYDQAVRGRGYPPALQEAHEAAVISMEERQFVQELLDEALARAGIVMQRTGKDASKRLRAV